MLPTIIIKELQPQYLSATNKYESSIMTCLNHYNVYRLQKLDDLIADNEFGLLQLGYSLLVRPLPMLKSKEKFDVTEM